MMDGCDGFPDESGRWEIEQTRGKASDRRAAGSDETTEKKQQIAALLSE